MVQSLPSSERRVAPRVPLTVKVQLFYRGVELQGYSTDVSETGIFVETPRPLPVGSVILMGFMLGGGRSTIQAEGRVVQVRTPEEANVRGGLPGMGIHFQGFLFGKSDLTSELNSRLDSLSKPDSTGGAPTAFDMQALVGIEVRWGTKPPPTLPGFLIDVRGNEAYLVAEFPAAPGAHLYLHFELPTRGLPQQVRAVAQVLSANFQPREGDVEPLGMGIAIDVESLEDPGVLGFVEQHLERMRQCVAPAAAAGAETADLPRQAHEDHQDGEEPTEDEVEATIREAVLAALESKPAEAPPEPPAPPVIPVIPAALELDLSWPDLDLSTDARAAHPAVPAILPELPPDLDLRAPNVSWSMDPRQTDLDAASPDEAVEESFLEPEPPDLDEATAKDPGTDEKAPPVRPRRIDWPRLSRMLIAICGAWGVLYCFLSLWLLIGD